MKAIKIRILKYKTSLPILLFLGTVLVSSILLFIFEKTTNVNIFTLFDTFWWSIVTMSTTGYGDIVPKSIVGRIVALLSIVMGVLATSLLTGTIASSFLNQTSRSRSGLMQYNKMSGHIVVCGWRENMINFLRQIIKSEKNDISKFVLVSDVNQALIDKIFVEKEMEGLKFVRGDFYDKNVLLKANVAQAKKAVILADKTSEGTIFEVDSRTVMAVISIKAMNRNVHVSAQLLERNFEVYLRRARCDEIIFSQEMNTEILAKIINQEGMSNVLSAILGNLGSQCDLSIEKIKHQFINKPFYELEKFFTHSSHTCILLGLLENTGRQYEIMDKIVRNAQMTANFSDMLENLRTAKQMQSYKPVLIPNKNYIIPKYSSAIILEKRND